MTLISSGFPSTNATLNVGLPSAHINVSRAQTTAQAIISTGGYIDPALSVDAIVQLESKDEFPEEGRISALYLDKQDGAVYRWDEDTEEYVSISAIQLSSDIVAGSLIISDSNGKLKCCGTTYESLNNRVEASVRTITGLPNTKSGNTVQINSIPVNLLKEIEGDVLVLDCGSSSSVL